MPSLLVAQSWPEERDKDEKGEFRRCYDNGKSDWPSPINQSSSKMCIRLPNGPEKDRELQAWEIDRLLYEMEDVTIDG